MSKLEEVQKKWIRLFQQLRCDPEIGDTFGAPFVSVAPIGYDPGTVASVLYIGMAERYLNDPEGLVDRDEFEREPSLDNRRRSTTQFLQTDVLGGGYDSAFWRFARRISNATASEKNIDGLQNLVWTNVCKLSDISKGNPTGRLLHFQADLAVETLRVEIAAYRPRLVCFLSNRYEKLIRRAIDDPNDESWHRQTIRSGNDWLRWRDKLDSYPAMLWMRHPERATNSYLDLCIQWAARLVARN